MKKSNEAIFKPFHIINLSILSLFLLGMIYFLLEGKLVTSFVYIFGSIILFLLFLEIRGQLRYNFLLKINTKILSYKDDKKVIRLEDIIEFVAIPGMFNTPSKLILETKKGTEELTLENYNRIKLKKITKVLNEKLEQL